MKDKLAIIGASYLQVPLIETAKRMGLETHVFAWAAGDVGEELADYFYPISIVEKERILECCRKIGIDGICSIASDLATVTVNYVAAAMGLTGNSEECVLLSTNKHAMRGAFEENGDPSPKSYLVESAEDLKNKAYRYPIIVKPLDRSGSRGITKLEDNSGLEEAIERAKGQGFIKKALVEEFAGGEEYSVECISWQGEHTFLAMTKKYTTGSPHFIETAHIQPAPVEADMLEKVKDIVFHALDSLKIKNGASHSEVKIDQNGHIFLIEIGARMGGDLIGSDLVKQSTGIDFVQAVIQVALGQKPCLQQKYERAAAVRFVFGKNDLEMLNRIKLQHPEYLICEDIHEQQQEEIKDSSMRSGYYLLSSDHAEELVSYMPEM